MTRSNFAPLVRFILMGLMMDNGKAIYLRAQVVKIHELYFTHHVILYQNEPVAPQRRGTDPINDNLRFSGL